MSRAEKLSPQTKDIFSLTTHIIKGEFDYSQAIPLLHSVCIESGSTPPYKEITSLEDLERHLRENADTPSDYNVPLATTKLAFIIIHPPSGIKSSHGWRPFASLCHHNFNPYSMFYRAE